MSSQDLGSLVCPVPGLCSIRSLRPPSLKALKMGLPVGAVVGLLLAALNGLTLPDGSVAGLSLSIDNLKLGLLHPRARRPGLQFIGT